MRILFEHRGVLPVTKYGGTERILFWLMKELARQGHEVFIIADPKSDLKKYGIQLISHLPGAAGKDWRPLIPKGIDLIHLFYSPDFDLPLPTLLTIGGSARPGESYPHNTVFVSRKHAALHNSDQFVYNGLDFEEYPYHGAPLRAMDKKWDSFLFLAKAKWKVKNVTDCIRVCKATKKDLHIAGGSGLSFSRRIHYYGMVEQKKKEALFSRCDALLWPVRWHEPFGIAVIEAFAAGLPVISSPYGSLPELVTEKVGFICQNYQDFFEKISLHQNPFNPDEIRNYVEQEFNIEKIAREYLRLYQIVASGGKLNRERPGNYTTIDPQTPLYF